MHPALKRVFFTGSAAIMFQLALCTLLLTLDLPIVAIAGCFLLGAPLGIAATAAAPGLAFPVMGILALSALAPALIVEAPMWGRTIQLRLVDDIPRHAGIAGYEAANWSIDISRTHEETLTAGRPRSRYGVRRLAPLVGDGWTPAHPVEVWVAGEIRDSGRVRLWHPQFWSEPGGAFVRLVGIELSSAQLHAGRAAARLGLIAAPEPLIVMRAPSIAQAQIDQAFGLARSALGLMGLLALLVLGAQFWLRRGGGPMLLRK